VREGWEGKKKKGERIFWPTLHQLFSVRGEEGKEKGGKGEKNRYPSFHISKGGLKKRRKETQKKGHLFVRKRIYESGDAVDRG